nr:Proteinase inhibitor I35 domain containing protein [Haemonchus contortus]
MACVISSKACSCLPFSSLEEEFCFSEWVSHVRATGRVRQNSTGFRPYYIYGIEHIKMYKNPSNTTNLPNRVYTATQSAACGITLRNNTEYLLGGRVDDNGTLFSNLCGLHREWRTVSAADRANLSSYAC